MHERNLSTNNLVAICFICVLLISSCMVSIQIPLGPYNPTKYALMQAAKENGTVRIMVNWKMDDYYSERFLSEREKKEQRSRIYYIQQLGIEQIKAKELNVVIVRNEQSSPRTIMIADEHALLYLFYMESIDSIFRHTRVGRTFANN